MPCSRCGQSLRLPASGAATVQCPACRTTAPVSTDPSRARSSGPSNRFLSAAVTAGAAAVLVAVIGLGSLYGGAPEVAAQATQGGAGSSAPPGGSAPAPPAGQGASPQVQAKRGPVLRIVHSPSDLFQLYTRECVALLDAQARRHGFDSAVYMAGSPELEKEGPGAATLLVVPESHNLTLALKPDGFDALDAVGAFSGPEHFAKFYASEHYASAFEKAAVKTFLPSHVLGFAYAATAQIYTRDKPMFSPADLAGRTQVGSFGAWWYAALHDRLRIGHDAVLGHTANTIAEQRAAATKAIGGRNQDEVFAVMTPVFAKALLPQSLRTFVSLSMTHTALLAFVGTNWTSLPEETQAALSAVLDQAIPACGAANFEREKTAMAEIEREGARVVAVESAFRGLPRQLLEKRIADATAKLEKAKKAKNQKDATEAEFERARGREQLEVYTLVQSVRGSQ